MVDNQLGDNTKFLELIRAHRRANLERFSQLDFSEDGKRIVLEKILSPTVFPTQGEVYSVMAEDYQRFIEAYDAHLKYTGAFLPTDGGCLWGSVYHIPTVEFEDALAECIISLNIKGNLLEVSAGSGKLSYGLRQRGIPIVAVDNNEIELATSSVEVMDHKTALNKYQPELVIASWLPPRKWGTGGIDKDVAEFSTLREYIRIMNDDCEVFDLNTKGVDLSGEEFLMRHFSNSFYDGPIRKCQDACISINTIKEKSRKFFWNHSEEMQEILKKGFGLRGRIFHYSRKD